MKRFTTAALLAIFGAAGSAAAQQNPPQPPPPPHAGMPGMAPTPAAPGMGMQGMQGMGGMMGNMMGMMGMMAPQGAREFLAMRAALGLTDTQAQQLRAIADQAEQAARPHMQAAMQAHHAAMQALEAEAPDPARFQAQLQEAATHFVEAQGALARSAIQALAVLTPEQRANVRFALRLQHERMTGAMMGGMMQGMGGMQGMGMQGMPGMQGMQGMQGMGRRDTAAAARRDTSHTMHH